MPTTFNQLSNNWSAEPNAPEPEVKASGFTVELTFGLNHFLFPQFQEDDWARIIFRNCWRFRLGATNDEGWYRGQCRFSRVAPVWGEFYELEGDLLTGFPGLEWQILSPEPDTSKHFLFYFRDDTFECDATDWAIMFHSAPR
jgi:hypothetical protein